MPPGEPFVSIRGSRTRIASRAQVAADSAPPHRGIHHNKETHCPIVPNTWDSSLQCASLLNELLNQFTVSRCNAGCLPVDLGKPPGPRCAKLCEQSTHLLFTPRRLGGFTQQRSTVITPARVITSAKDTIVSVLFCCSVMVPTTGIELMTY